MNVIAINVPINLASRLLISYKKATTDKDVILPFDGLISRITIMAKVPLYDSEPIIHIF
jgi:hypothetical protein